MIEIGKTYYFVCHAYYHWVGTVVKITGKKECIVNNCVRVHACGRDFSGFFADGFGDDTTYTVWPDGTSVSDWFCVAPFEHRVPRRKK